MTEIPFDAEMRGEFSGEFSAKLGELNHLLIAAEHDGDGEGAITEMFRAAHSLKGLAALAGLEAFGALTHELETVFERVRKGEAAFSGRVVKAAFAACDQLQRLLEDFTGGGNASGDIAPCVAVLRASTEEDDGLPPAEAPAAAPEGVTPSGTEAGAERSVRQGQDLEMLRVDPGRLDSVLNLSSELLVARARLHDQYRGLAALARGLDADAARAAASGDPAGAERMRAAIAAIESMDQSVRTVHRLSSRIQHEATRLRMVPVGPLFRRFERVLRDACVATGHEARLLISGERTELDKSLVDHLIDPLTHLIRNAVDHGLEGPGERQAKGKRARGAVRLEAAHESGHVVIRVSDDGRGIDPARLRRAVAERGLLSAEQAALLSDREAIAWIFAPGFSTAERVTDISGRGVGLDIVRSAITDLGGSVEVESAPGVGTAFVVRLPLTLAMVRALLVEAAGGRYAVPLQSVRAVVRLEERQVRRVAGSAAHLDVRGELLPLVCLKSGTAGGAGWAVLARAKDQAVAIQVDRVLREEELVVKPIPPRLRAIGCASGAAVLGDGSLALLIDVAALRAGRIATSERQSA
jgi:two-component system chemotaxis sensor kinase CheA